MVAFGAVAATRPDAVMRKLFAMPTEASKKNGNDAYSVACDRVLSHVIPLVQAKGVPVGVDIDPGLRQLATGRMRFDPVVHHIELTYGRRTRLVSVDHDTFMEVEFFRTLVLHQIEAAINELASRA
jgi:hypothetical protein